jgi:hypothetical protein
MPVMRRRPKSRIFGAVIHPQTAMKKQSLFIPTLLAVVAIAGLSNPVLAQNNSLRDGAWALQFAVDDNFMLESFQGATISAKHHYSDATALRYGLTLDFLSETDEGGDDENELSVALATQYLMYPTVDRGRNDRVHLFWGFGPEVAFMRTENETTEATDRTWRGAVTVLVGGEWFVHRRVSLTGEYSTSLFYANRQVEALGVEETDSQFGLSANGVRFGISLYVRAD